MNITSKQWYQIAASVVSGLITGAALLQTLFGQDLTLKIVASLGIVNIVIGSVGAALSGQSSSLQDVKNMSETGGPVGQQAKVALLDATASMPEVTGNIHVTDKALAEATVSKQVKTP
jgi:hypothetical protein